MYTKEKDPEEEYYYYEEEPENTEQQQNGELAESVLRQTTSQVEQESVPKKKDKKSKKEEIVELKVDQEYVLTALKEFMEHNQSLQHLDLISTGLNQQSILDLIQMLKDNESSEEKVRNIVSVHFSFPNPFDKKPILDKLQEALKSQSTNDAIKIQHQDHNSSE